MTTLGDLFRRRTLWIGFIAAFLPLILILALQYWSLSRLEESSALAGRAVLTNFFDAVNTEVFYTYAPSAERTLDVPYTVFTKGPLERAAAHFRRKTGDGVKTLFVVRFEDDGSAVTLIYDPREDRIAPAEPSEETRAITVASAPWKLMHDKGIEADSPRLVVEERDPANRIVLNPVLDTDSRVVGIAGLVLDSEDFKTRFLPTTIATLSPKFFSGYFMSDVVISVRDRSGAVLFSSDPAAPPPAEEISRPLSFVFTDWRLGVHSRGKTPEQWARAGFAFNVTLSALAGLLLMGGLALALRTASREMKLSRMKSDFVSNVSHELRTPLASIRVFGEFLRLGRASTPEKVREYGEYIEKESRRLTQLINNILDFAKIEAGRKNYRFERADVGQLLADTIATFEIRLKHTGFAIEFQRPDEPFVCPRVDTEALGQAIHNLLDNAVNYSGESRWIGASIRREDGEIVVSIADQGIGIANDELAKVFDRFHRVGTGLVHEVRGTGLGLAIVRHIVSAHGGRVTLESTPGRGSTFEIHLPTGKASTAGPATSRSPARGTGADRETALQGE